MDFTSICRTCLSTKYLNPIFKEKSDHGRYSTAVYITTGLKVELNDGLPQRMCSNCMKLLNDSLKFRKQCKDVETHLLSILDSKQSHAGDEKTDIKDAFLVEHIFKRKSTNDEYINIKIEQATSVNDDEVPLKYLIKNTIDKNYREVKAEPQFIKFNVENENQKSNRDHFEIFNETYSADIVESVEHVSPEDVKYKEEYLDPHFEFNSESDGNETLCTNDTNKTRNTKRNPKTAKSRMKSLNDVTNTETLPFIVHDSKRVTCKLCQKDFTKRSIDMHMVKKHPGADTRKEKCDLCDTYVMRERLNRHKMIMHGKDCLMCRYCKTEFPDRTVLIEHLPSCMAVNNKRKRNPAAKMSPTLVECEECHKTMQKGSLRLHKEIKHAGMGPVCEHCGRRFGNKLRLLEHLRAKHGYEKFQCPDCDFRSASRMAMQNHSRRHRGEKPFSCATCGAAFHARSLLAQHAHSHRAHRDRKCDECPAAFKSNNTLHMHKISCHNTHTYQCNMCPRTYRCRHYAVKHIRNVHRYTGPVGGLREATPPAGPPPRPAHTGTALWREQAE